MSTLLLLITKLGPVIIGAVTAIGGVGIFLAVKKARVRIIQMLDGTYLVKVRLGLGLPKWLYNEYNPTLLVRRAANYKTRDKAIKAATTYLSQHGVKHDSEVIATVSESANGTPTLPV